jgi:hexulose-6-phosphate isomerase
MENVWNTFFTSPWDMMVFVDKFECEYITAYYDVGNTVAFTWTQHWIEVLNKRISHIHVKDYKRANAWPNSGGEFVDLGEGSIHWPKVMEALKNIGFDGYLTAEVFKSDESISYQDYYKSISVALDKIIKGEA